MLSDTTIQDVLLKLHRYLEHPDFSGKVLGPTMVLRIEYFLDEELKRAGIDERDPGARMLPILQEMAADLKALRIKEDSR